MRKALVVGINNYPSAPLLGCINDATEITALLERDDDGKPNFSVLLKKDIRRKGDLLKLTADLFTGGSETELFYFSGHGFINKLGGYLVVPENRRYEEGVSMNDILTLANDSTSANKIIILDCCHSGAVATSNVSAGTLIHINEGVTILTASRQSEAAMEVNGRGVFTSLLLEALKGGAANINGQITPASVYAYIDQALGPWEQRPAFKANISGFTSLRNATPRIDASILRTLIEYFPEPNDPYALSPSYEYTNDPHWKHDFKIPYANPDNVIIFKHLQKMQAAGLIDPVEEEHLYWAAMNNKSCRLTPLGAHYWRLTKEKKI